mgnify:CR=1 FL=1
MPKNIDSEIEKLYLNLCTELDHFKQGEQFCSVREIMRKHAVSRRTVEKALARLESERQVVIEPASGIFVSRSRCKKSFIIASVHCDWPAEYWRNLDSALEEELRKYPDFKFNRAFFEPESGDYLRHLKSLHVDAILLTLPTHSLSCPEVAAVLDLPVPVIFLENNILCGGIHCIDSQPEYSGMMAADCLIRNGHEKLALILSEPFGIGTNRRNEGFLGYARLHGIEPVVIDCEVKSGEASCAKAHDKILENLERNGLTFTGCCAMSDYSALGIIGAFKEFGLHVPEDVSIVGAGGIASSAHFDPPLTTIANDIPGTVCAIVEGLRVLFDGGNFGIRTVPSILIERQSVRNLLNPIRKLNQERMRK